jgi:hypothetical protein
LTFVSEEVKILIESGKSFISIAKNNRQYFPEAIKGSAG